MKRPLKYSNLNTKPISNREYIESHNYINGVKDSKGRILIRKLTPEEQEFIFKFESEVYVADFNYAPEIKKLLRERKKLIKELANSPEIVGKEIELLESMMEKVDSHKERQKLLYRIAKFNAGKYVSFCREFLAKTLFPTQIDAINAEIDAIRQEVNLYKTPEERSALYKDKNHRNHDVMINGKAKGYLKDLDIIELDSFYEKNASNISYEDLLIIDKKDKLS